MTSTTSILVILLLFVAPLLLGVFLIVIASKAKTKSVKYIAGIFGAVSISFLLMMLVLIVPYLWALHLEENWTIARPSTMIEMESHLSLFSKKVIQPSMSEWGQNHVMRDGDQMIRYMILWNAPLDIVYDQDDKIVAIYTTYE